MPAARLPHQALSASRVSRAAVDKRPLHWSEPFFAASVPQICYNPRQIRVDVMHDAYCSATYLSALRLLQLIVQDGLPVCSEGRKCSCTETRLRTFDSHEVRYESCETRAHHGMPVVSWMSVADAKSF